MSLWKSGQTKNYTDTKYDEMTSYVDGKQTAMTSYVDGKQTAMTSYVDTSDSNIVKAANSQFNTKSTSQSLITTATTSGSTGIQIINDSNINFATGDFSINIVLAVPDWTPAANVILAQKHDSTNGWILTLLTTGKLRLTINSTTYDSTTAITASNGYFADIVVAIKRETATVDGYVLFAQDGRQLGESVTITAASPTTVDNTSVLYLAGTSASQVRTNIIKFNVYNRDLSTLNIAHIYANGSMQENNYATQTPIYTSDFSSGVDGWSKTGVTLSYNQTIAGENGWLVITTNTETRVFAANKTLTNFLGYRLYNIKMKLYKPSTLELQACYIMFGSYRFLSVDYIDNISSITTGYGYNSDAILNIDLDVYLTNNLANMLSVRIGNANGFTGVPADDWAAIKDVVITPIGTTLQYQDNNLQQKQWLDSSINKLHAMLPATGSDLKLSKNSFEIRWVNTWAGTHEAQYIGGFNQAILPIGCYIESMIGVISGTTIEDIIVGDGSDTDRWVAATTGLAAGTVSFTIANRISDSTNYKMIVDPDNAANMSISWVIKGIIL